MSCRFRRVYPYILPFTGDATKLFRRGKVTSSLFTLVITFLKVCSPWVF